MAITDVVNPQRQTFYVGDITFRRPTSENLLRKFASASNYIMDRIFYSEKTTFKGYFKASAPDDFSALSDIIYIPNRCNIYTYTMSVMAVRNTGNISVNYRIYDATNTVVGDLFSTAPIINQAGLIRATVGKKVETATDIIIGAGTGYNTGTLAFTELQEGWTLVPRITSSTDRAITLVSTLFLKPLE